MSVSLAAFYNAVHRNVWGACLCWVVIACVTGNGGFVNTILSWPALIPLSRLTYCIYLLHIMLMDLYLLNNGTVFYFTDLNVIMFVLGILVVSYMAAVITSLAFEAPMMALEKVIFPRDRRRQTDSRQVMNGNVTSYNVSYTNGVSGPAMNGTVQIGKGQQNGTKVTANGVGV